MRHGHGAVLDPDLIAVGVIAVVVRVEGEADRFVGKRFDLRDDFLSAGREVRVDHKDVVFKYYPSVVAMADQQIALMEKDAVGNLIDFADFDGAVSREMFLRQLLIRWRRR